jgi:hypothetical protein
VFDQFGNQEGVEDDGRERQNENGKEPVARFGGYNG